MKKIKTTDIVSGVAYPPSKKGLDFLQQSYQEVLSQLAQTFVGNTPSTTIGYVLYGCVQTDLGAGNYSYTAGAIYFNGEVYAVDAIASIAIATAPVLTITTTNDPTADPTIFTDGSSKNVHNIRKLVISDGALGSADLNYVDLKIISGQHEQWINYDLSGKITASGGGLSASAGNFVYKKVGRTISFYFTVTATTTGVPTGLALDLSNFLVRNSSLQYITTGLELLALNEVVKIQINSTGSTMNLSKLTGLLTATSYSFYGSGVMEF